MSKPYWRNSDLVSEVEHLLNFGESPTNVLMRLDLRATQVERAFYRAEKPEISRLFSAVRPVRTRTKRKKKPLERTKS